jgi:hypothetical protein
LKNRIETAKEYDRHFESVMGKHKPRRKGYLGSDGRPLVPGGYNDSLYRNDRSRGNFNFNLDFGN